MAKAKKKRKINKVNLGVLAAILFFGVVFLSIKPNITGRAVAEIPQEKKILDEIYPLTDLINVIYIEKSPDSSLRVNAKSEYPVTIFAETNDCDAWNNGEDNDGSVLQAVENAKETEFKVGNMREQRDSRPQLELYHADRICIVVINRDNGNSLSFSASEYDNGLWQITW